MIGGLHAVSTLRRARAPQPMPMAASWCELGLNGRVFTEYRSAARNAGFQLTRFDPIPVKGLHALTRLPGINRFVTFGVDARLERPAHVDTDP